MRALPLGIPKVMVSTLASSDVRGFVGVKDIAMMPTIVDISGAVDGSSETPTSPVWRRGRPPW